MRQRGPGALWRRSNSFPVFRQWGDVSRIALACGITVQSVSEWKRVPERHLPVVAKLLDVTPDRLRPDLAVRNLMTRDMDPRDAAQAEEFVRKAAWEVDGKRLRLADATSHKARTAARLAEAQAEYERAVVDVRRARSILSRTRHGYILQGVPEGRLGPLTDVGPPDYPPDLPSPA